MCLVIKVSVGRSGPAPAPDRRWRGAVKSGQRRGRPAAAGVSPAADTRAGAGLGSARQGRSIMMHGRRCELHGWVGHSHGPRGAAASVLACLSTRRHRHYARRPPGLHAVRGAGDAFFLEERFACRHDRSISLTVTAQRPGGPGATCVHCIAW